ncbi:hypothetical protein RSOLAG22IIIB_08685 [Rhizoctonia solani]|uniref:DUF6535 domain-containing protein n=1 Tax=Rhizoctonia solani TaxID=456999 RepID=A0A0K6FUN0_9AGAM|nr:hypothetical protein RSOLAG22IIIB_08685 [Rhizoctonia solani]
MGKRRASFLVVNFASDFNRVKHAGREQITRPPPSKFDHTEMSLLIPTNLSNASKGKRKPDKKNTTFDYKSSASVQEGNESENELLDPGDQPNADGKARKPDERPRKRAPVPVALVNPDPVQMMEPDEYGAELGKEARVWKIYVQETDKWDKELVDGWNKSLDVILVFAALFSTVSTSFLIESSGMLKQDPNDVSATALVAISQALLTIANNSSADMRNSPFSPPDASSSFVAPHHAVIVNALWFLSLSLSVATSLLAMLAKDWCHSFIANRTGHPWDQALRRQRKWVKIEQCKMQELITVLPSLIHLSLLLFAIGLCIYVWDLNMTAAVPVPDGKFYEAFPVHHDHIYDPAI